LKNNLYNVENRQDYTDFSAKNRRGKSQTQRNFPHNRRGGVYPPARQRGKTSVNTVGATARVAPTVLTEICGMGRAIGNRPYGVIHTFAHMYHEIQYLY
jgi:hypothetical protein